MVSVISYYIFGIECSGVGGALLDTPCMIFQRVCVCVVPVITVCV